jgi:G:T-mismatch repair DNA endonuclease (very short patch repair protein)
MEVEMGWACGTCGRGIIQVVDVTAERKETTWKTYVIWECNIKMKWHGRAWKGFIWLISLFQKFKTSLKGCQFESAKNTQEKLP